MSRVKIISVVSNLYQYNLWFITADIIIVENCKPLVGSKESTEDLEREAVLGRGCGVPSSLSLLKDTRYWILDAGYLVLSSEFRVKSKN